MTVPLLTRWMLVFEEPALDVVWLAKGTPRSWLEDGNTIAVSNAPTRWGSLSFSLRSHLQTGLIEARVVAPDIPTSAHIQLRLRVPAGHRIRSGTANGKPWDHFDAEDEAVTVPSAGKRPLDLAILY